MAMIAYLTSIGEVTTSVAKWSLERNGFEVIEVYSPDSSLSTKLQYIYNTTDEDFVRVDADVIVNQKFTPGLLSIYAGEVWWWQFQCFDWFKQDVGYGGVQFIRKQAIPHLKANIDRFIDSERPETELSRIKEFYEPRRFESVDKLVGLNNFKNDIKRVKEVKDRREQFDYDWDLAERLSQL